MYLIDTILSDRELVEKPPVLLDIGASGFLPHEWKQIAPYSVCIAFDADSRDVQHLEDDASVYRTLHVYPAVVTDVETDAIPFYLTKSPHCSSALPPNAGTLQPWLFADSFMIEEQRKIPSVTLRKALSAIGVEQIDWFKCDSQGTDLRLFKSLGTDLMARVLLADFEPGIIDAYQGEDKLWRVMSFMDGMPFWMSRIQVKGCQRGEVGRLRTSIGRFFMKVFEQSHRASPGWAEVRYLNTLSFDADDCFGRRDYLLAWVFASIDAQYGFALEIAENGYAKFNDPLFLKMQSASKRKIFTGLLKMPLALVRFCVARVLGAKSRLRRECV